MRIPWKGDLDVLDGTMSYQLFPCSLVSINYTCRPQLHARCFRVRAKIFQASREKAFVILALGPSQE